uniref:Uncharacterized protein n=1 Tax=Oxyrrhis marina TaxID=2969 RepID=A0A7S3UL35_OXYMA|mmetsp:Transcript_91/g.143  ORF Transcript_91/g.143 Transcript_91/m.143 type:complete len:124 (-) Transcript_91:19-390(-)
MSTRTAALPHDFPHFAAWYGQLPSFQQLSHPDFANCRSERFRLRQLVDARYFLHSHYADHKNALTKATIKTAFEDWMMCRRITSLPADERPKAHKEWYKHKLERVAVNDVWEYRPLPKVAVTM